MVEDGERIFCCAIKQYYSQHANLVDSLDISPRVVLCKKPLKIHQTYEQTVTVKNMGMYPRAIKWSTDSPEDTTVRVFNIKSYEYLLPTATLNVIVSVKPLTTKGIKRRRHVFLECRHPNVKIEIPIISIHKHDQGSVPSFIELPQSVPKTFTYYEFTVYNATIATASINLRTTNNCLTAQAVSTKIEAKDFVRVLLKFNVQNMDTVHAVVKLRFGKETYDMEVVHQPKPAAIYLSTLFVKFDEVKFEREVLKQFTICNEGNISIPFNFSFNQVNPHSELDEPENILPGPELQKELSKNSFVSESSETSNAAELIQKKNVVDNTIANKSFKIQPQEGQLTPYSSTVVRVKFHPLFDTVEYESDMSPPFELNTEILCTSSMYDLGDDAYVIISGSISGPEMFVTPKAIDFRKVYLGEEHCEKIHFTNIDGIVTCMVKFLDYSSPDMAKAFITPEAGFKLGPCETGVFNFTFFTLIVGSIFFKLRFKVQNGEILIVIVKATSSPVRVKVFPDFVEFGNVPFAVPQKRTVLLMNPLSVPISLQCFLPDNGSETPLLLNVDDVQDLPPVTIKNPVEDIIAVQNEDKVSAYHSSELDKIEYKSLCSELSFNSACEGDDLTLCSEGFQRDVVESLSDIAYKVLAMIKAKRISEKPEPEVKLLRTATDELLKLPYFFELIRYNNYACMKWDTVPSDPIEVYFDTEIIHLKPNAGRSFTILIIPNVIGYFNRAINIRCCPHVQAYEDDPSKKNPYEMIVDSDLMVTKIWFEYNCRIPVITWKNEIKLDGQRVYAMQNYNIDIEFKNDSKIGGFIHFIVVPSCPEGVLRFRDSVWKFYIPAGETETAKCEVEFRRLGEITLTGMVKIVGSSIGTPFHIRGNILPPRIHITPTEIYKRQNVLERTYVYVYIHNLTPTSTGFRLYLQNENYQTINPRGAQLAPTGQGMYVEINTMYRDPEVYKNTLFIDMLYGVTKKIPLTYNVIGMPVFFDPDITKNLDAGVILLSSENDYENRVANFSRTIRVWNMGERPYVITFSKLKSTVSAHHKCPAEPIKAQLTVRPKSFHLKPGEESFIYVTAVSCQEVLLYSEFRYGVVDQLNIQRYLSKSFSITAKFTLTNLCWNRKEVRMQFKRTHEFQQQSQLELAELINMTGAPVHNVRLKVFGPFKIKACYEHPFTKEVIINMCENERREITILLNHTEFNCSRLPFYKGKIFCYTTDGRQKTLPLRVDISYPDIIIVESDLVIFSTSDEGHTEILLENVGNLDAQYKWKKLGECIEYVAEFDDYEAYARSILSDIIQMLELHDNDEQANDTICKENMSLCYEKYRCKLAALEDPDNITGIIYEIIENIDLENRRYKIHFDDDFPESVDSEGTEISSKHCIRETLDKVLEKLKLEDTYEVSAPSEQECFENQHLHFYEKSGVVLAKSGAYSMLHLPPVRKGYAQMACFLLDVVGGVEHKLFVTLVNLEKAVELFPSGVYLGVRPWYDMFKANIRVENVTQFRVNIHVDDNPRPKEAGRHHNYLIDGYACILSSRIFYLNPYCSHCIKTEGVVGFSDEFVRDFKVNINDTLSTSFRLRGQGVMPILLATHNTWKRPDQSEAQVIEEYRLLQRIYYFYIFRDITFVEEDLEFPLEEEASEMVKKEITLSQISVETFSDTSSNEEENSEGTSKKWELLLGTYVFVYNNDNLPNATILEQCINMEKFLVILNDNPSKRNILQHLYRDHMKFFKRYDPQIPTNLKYFTVQPLPFEQLGYVIDMSNLRLQQFRKYEIDLQFFGPGKLIACARTAVKIPGLYVHFEVRGSSAHEFELHRAEEKMPDVYTKKYRNMWERQLYKENDPKLQHAHSFGCEVRCKFHKRDVPNLTINDRKDINNYYNSLNKSVHLENKHHFINCVIFSKSQENFSGTILRVHILFKANSKYYTEGQVFEDFLYVDLHMGPTVPLLMRGLIK